MQSIQKCTLRPILIAIVLAVASVSQGIAADKQVTIGYQLMVNPWKVAIVNKAFERATGYHIKWVQFSSGSQAARGLASGAVQISSIGSVPLAAAVSNGVPVQLFWILEAIGSNEKLVVRRGAGIRGPKDLAGKKLGVPVASTSDLDLYYALKSWHVKAHVLDMQPQAIVAAWSRGNIDGAFVWDPALSRIEQSGHAMVTSGQICKRAKLCTFDGLAVSTSWAKAHPRFMVKFVRVLNRITSHYMAHKKKWTPQSSMIKKIARLNGVKPADAPKVLSNYRFIAARRQVSPAWLTGGAQHSMAVSAKFLKQRGEVGHVLSDYGKSVTAKWVKMALKR